MDIHIFMVCQIKNGVIIMNKQKTEQKQLSVVDRFTNSVISCYGDEEISLAPTEKEKKLIQGYFWNIDLMLKNSKEGYNWSMVKMSELAPRLKNCAQLGLDMSLPNNLFPVAYKDGNSGKINIVLTKGYNGYKNIAMKFSANRVKDIIVHLVGENDTFKAIYKDVNHPNDNYIFEEKSFNKGDTIGGFSYVVYEDESLNKLVVMSLDEIKKHMPKRGSTFWTGEWAFKMYIKTLIIEAAKTISINPDKVLEYKNIMERMKADELENEKILSSVEASKKMSSGDIIDIDFEDVASDSEYDEAHVGQQSLE